VFQKPPKKSILKNFFTVDVEDWFNGRVDKTDQWDSFENRLEIGLSPILNLLSQKKSQATFFILGYSAERSKTQIQVIHQEGHEIASHGYWHRFVFNQTPLAFEQDFIKSKTVLENMTGQPIRGFRASAFSITRKSAWALDILEKNGIQYDASINPLYSGMLKNQGMGAIPGRALLEFPVSALRWGPFRLPFSGGFYLRVFPIKWVIKEIEKRNKRGEAVMVYIHPWEFDQAQPQKIYSPVIQRIRDFNIASVESKIKTLLNHFSFTSIRDSLKSEKKYGSD